MSTDYTIKHTGKSMTIINNATGDVRAEYLLTPGSERKEIAAMRRAIDKHLANGGTLDNYQF